MGQLFRAVASLSFLLLIATTASAQVGAPLPQLESGRIRAAAERAGTAPDLSGDGGTGRGVEVAVWVREYTEWKEWSERWGNRRQPGWFTASQERRDAPVPPAWLAASCVWVADELDPLTRACALLREWNEGPVASQLRAATASAVAQKEAESKATWWQHLHIDLLWPAMQWRTSTYGVIGMHAATTVHGRFQAFVAPGVMLLNLPTRSGNRTWRVAANYGIGYRLFDFVFPGGRPASLNVNAARAWVVSDVTDIVTGRSVDFAGFSVTFKKAP